MFSYRVYGLTVDCDSRLPELVASKSDVEPHPAIRVRLSAADSHFSEPRRWLIVSDPAPDIIEIACGKTLGGYLFRFAGFAEFWVAQDGLQIICCRVEPDVTEVTVRHLLLDRVLPMVLSLLGREALHATAVLTAKGVCVFIGPAGSGKSTLAASFFLAGYTTLGDDCIAIQLEDDVLAIPAYPGLRLCTDAAESLAATSRHSLPVSQYNSKRRMLGVESARNFPADALPLIRIYRLQRAQTSVSENGRGAACSIEPLSGKEAFMEVVGSTFPLDVEDRKTLKHHFRFVERLIRRVPVRRLRMPNDLSALPAVRQAVLADAGAV